MRTAPSELQTTPIPGPHQGPSPDKFFETMTAYQHIAALQAAIELDLFTAIGDGRNTVSSLTKRIHGSERALRILCDCLVVIGFLTKTDDHYGLTADSAVFLDKKSQAYIGSAKNFLASPIRMEGFNDLATVVRSGRPLADHPFSGAEHINFQMPHSPSPNCPLPPKGARRHASGKTQPRLGAQPGVRYGTVDGDSRAIATQ